MLQEFITEGNDSNLGFKNFEELNRAYIKVDEGLPIFGLIIDSMLDNGSPLDSHLVHFNARIYPVYVGNVLHSAITFDTVFHQWRPIIFDDAKVLGTYGEDLHDSTSKTKSQDYAFVDAQLINTDFVLKHDTKGDHVLTTSGLKRQLGKDFPRSQHTGSSEEVGKEEFFASLKNHMHKNQKK